MSKIKTLEELKFFCYENNIPLEKARFAIGEDKTEIRWFGIYQRSDGLWVVYKNKDDGSRFIRYQGESEEEAVNILLDKIKSEVRLRKTGEASLTSKKRKKKQKRINIITLIGYIFIVFFILISIFRCSVRNIGEGYYQYKDKHFYRKNNDWYYYDPYYNSWYRDYYEYADDIFYEDYKDFYIGDDYQDDFNFDDFKDTDYYHSYSNNYDDDDDYDYSWDSDSSWDSFDTDWGSDW